MKFYTRRKTNNKQIEIKYDTVQTNIRSLSLEKQYLNRWVYVIVMMSNI